MTKNQDEGTPQPDGNVHFKKDQPDNSNKDHDKKDQDSQPEPDGGVQPDGNVHFNSTEK